MAQTAIDQARSSLMLNANLPVGGTAGYPGTQLTALAASAMKLKLTSTASSASSSGTELSGTGYTAGGTAFSDIATSQASSSGSNVLLPKTTAFSWTNGSGGSWSIVSLELTDGSATRVWYGNWNGQPISVANGNTFQVAAQAISAGGF
jgi:hypothetical protein